MIFPVLETEDVVQVGDMTRLSAGKSYVSKGEPEITKVEIQPEADADWIDITGTARPDWLLDWAYGGVTRTVVASLRITTTAADADADPVVEAVTEAIEKSISIVIAADDYLFSGDADIIPFEPDVLNWTYPGRATFLNVHRAAQTRIMETLDEMGVTDDEGLKLTKTAVVDITEVRAWSRDLALHLIFKSLINAVDDVFTSKSRYYASEASKRQSRAVLRLDLNGDGEIKLGEQVQTMSMELVRR